MARKIKRLTPEKIKEMSEAEMRAKYTEYRDIAQKRLKRLEEAGYDFTDLYQKGDFPVLKGQTPRQIRQNLQNVSEFLHDPRSLASKMKTISEKIQTGLSKRGFVLEQEQISDMGRFLKWVRERYKNRTMPPSDDIIQLYENAERLNISVDTLKRKFKDYILDKYKAEQLAITLESMELPANRVQIRSNEVIKAFNDDWGFDDT